MSRFLIFTSLICLSHFGTLNTFTFLQFTVLDYFSRLDHQGLVSKRYSLREVIVGDTAPLLGPLSGSDLESLTGCAIGQPKVFLVASQFFLSAALAGATIL